MVATIAVWSYDDSWCVIPASSLILEFAPSAPIRMRAEIVSPADIVTVTDEPEEAIAVGA